jgi:hypothetical protein
LQNPIDLIPKPPDHEMGPTGHESNKIGYFWWGFWEPPQNEKKGSEMGSPGGRIDP